MVWKHCSSRMLLLFQGIRYFAAVSTHRSFCRYFQVFRHFVDILKQTTFCIWTWLSPAWTVELISMTKHRTTMLSQLVSTCENFLRTSQIMAWGTNMHPFVSPKFHPRLMNGAMLVLAPPCSLFVPACSSVHRRTVANPEGNQAVLKVRLAQRIWRNMDSWIIGKVD